MHHQALRMTACTCDTPTRLAAASCGVVLGLGGYARWQVTVEALIFWLPGSTAPYLPTLQYILVPLSPPLPPRHTHACTTPMPAPASQTAPCQHPAHPNCTPANPSGSSCDPPGWKETHQRVARHPYASGLKRHRSQPRSARSLIRSQVRGCWRQASAYAGGAARGGSHHDGEQPVLLTLC